MVVNWGIESNNEKGGDLMPRGDSTGPEGTGPMTGRAAGFCAGYSNPGYGNPVGGRGFGMGYGRGFGGGRGMGWGRMARWGNYDMPLQYGEVPVQPTLMNEKTILQNRLQLLQKQVTDINKRIEELDKTREQ